MKKILIVDDAALMRILLKSILEKNRFQVIGEAENGVIGVKKYLELKPDLVTMDIIMPEMDGLAALQEIRRQDTNAKVVMITGLGQELFVKAAILSGAKGFIVKPYKEEHVIKILSRL